MVTQRIANPFIPVRFWAWPPIKGKMDKEILKIALNTVNQEVPKSHTHYSRLKNSQCGDEIKIYMKVSKGKIVNLNYITLFVLKSEKMSTIRNGKNKIINYNRC